MAETPRKRTGGQPHPTVVNNENAKVVSIFRKYLERKMTAR